MLELYHNNISVCAQKVRIVLAEKNVRMPLREPCRTPLSSRTCPAPRGAREAPRLWEIG